MAAQRPHEDALDIALRHRVAAVSRHVASNDSLDSRGAANAKYVASDDDALDNALENKLAELQRNLMEKRTQDHQHDAARQLLQAVAKVAPHQTGSDELGSKLHANIQSLNHFITRENAKCDTDRESQQAYCEPQDDEIGYQFQERIACLNHFIKNNIADGKSFGEHLEIQNQNAASDLLDNALAMDFQESAFTCWEESADPYVQSLEEYHNESTGSGWFLGALGPEWTSPLGSFVVGQPLANLSCEPTLASQGQTPALESMQFLSMPAHTNSEGNSWSSTNIFEASSGSARSLHSSIEDCTGMQSHSISPCLLSTAPNRSYSSECSAVRLPSAAALPTCTLAPQMGMSSLPLPGQFPVRATAFKDDLVTMQPSPPGLQSQPVLLSTFGEEHVLSNYESTTASDDEVSDWSGHSLEEDSECKLNDEGDPHLHCIQKQTTEGVDWQPWSKDKVERLLTIAQDDFTPWVWSAFSADGVKEQ